VIEEEESMFKTDESSLDLSPLRRSTSELRCEDRSPKFGAKQPLFNGINVKQVTPCTKKFSTITGSVATEHTEAGQVPWS